jgi:diadenosine tetraphosphate (Ap4A) HIT family hydrolase
MTINPITAGHVLVVPIDEVDEWTDLSSELRSQLFKVAAQIGEAQKMAFKCERIALIIAGFEVPHCHLHLIPSNSMADLNFENAVTSANRDDLEQSSSLIVDELRRMNIAGAI